MPGEREKAYTAVFRVGKGISRQERLVEKVGIRAGAGGAWATMGEKSIICEE